VAVRCTGCESSLSICAPDGHLLRVTIPDAVLIQFDLLRMSKILLETVHVEDYNKCINPLNAELNPICHLLVLLGAHHILHVGRLRVKNLCIKLAIG